MYNNLFLELFIHKKDYNSKFWKLYKYIPIKDILIAPYILWILLFDFLFDLPIGPNALGVCIKYLEKPYIHVNNNCFLVLILLSWPHNYTGFNNMNSAKSIKQNTNTQTHNIVIICSGYRTPKIHLIEVRNLSKKQFKIQRFHHMWWLNSGIGCWLLGGQLLINVCSLN